MGSALGIAGLWCAAIVLLTLPLLVLGIGSAFLLAAAGLAKIVDGSSATAAVRVLVPFAPRWLAGVVGVAEVLVALAFIALPGAITSGLLGLAYLALGLFAAGIRGKAETCGCFGGASAGVTSSHLWVCGVSAAVGVALVATGIPEFSAPATAVIWMLGGAVALLAYGLLGPAAGLREALAEVNP